MKSFPQGDTSARQRGFEIKVSPLLGELPKAIETHLPVCQMATRSQQVDFAYNQITKPHCTYRPSAGLPSGFLGPATCGFACNWVVPEAGTTEAYSSTKEERKKPAG